MTKTLKTKKVWEVWSRIVEGLSEFIENTFCKPLVEEGAQELQALFFFPLLSWRGQAQVALPRILGAFLSR